jgi:peptide/nickel transport system permease protein
MTIKQLLARLVVFFVVVWAASTLIFILPHLSSSSNAVSALGRQLGQGDPLWRQYIVFLGNFAQMDFGYSRSLYPTKVMTLIWQSMPYTLGLVGVSTLLAFLFGSLAGALLGWPRAPRFIHFLFPPLLVLSAVPYFLLGIALMFFFAFKWGWFPIGGASPITAFPEWTIGYAWQLTYHAILPAMSIILSGIGFWALTMRAMMVTVVAEDYIVLAEMRGLKPRRIFFQYGLRNALMPQITALGLSLGYIISGVMLVEWIFRYPGIGFLLFGAIVAYDYSLIYGVVFILILGIALSTLLLDFLYPLLDPRIRGGTG